jgi:hypothetical protein
MAKTDIAIEMADDLLRFQELVNRHMASYVDCTKIRGVADRLKAKFNKGTEECWAFEKVDIIFRKMDLGNDICPEIEPSFLELAVLKLVLEMSGFRNVSDEANDPITPLEDKNLPGFCLQLILSIGDFEDFLAKCSWHFDRHPEGNAPEFHHPLYHVHFGGKEINQGQLQYGNVLIIESPRLLHPPMDLILGIDFVLSNFYSRHSCIGYTDLLNEPLYCKLVEKARKRFWQPYFLGLASNFAPNLSYNLNHFNHLTVKETHAKNLLSCS